GAIFAAAFFVQPRMADLTKVDLLSTNPFDDGCFDRTATLTPPIQIDNDANTYHVEAYLVNFDSGVQLQSARVGFVLQVSPASAAATFGDVPVGHSQRQYIEALVASGVTAGCGGGNYCPDAPLTRGQMAVFLSKALGLHFAP